MTGEKAYEISEQRYTDWLEQAGSAGAGVVKLAFKDTGAIFVDDPLFKALEKQDIDAAKQIIWSEQVLGQRESFLRQVAPIARQSGFRRFYAVGVGEKESAQYNLPNVHGAIHAIFGYAFFAL